MAKKHALLALAALATGTLMFSGCTGESTPDDAGSSQLLTISRETGATFTLNFNPFSPNALPMTTTAIYEPLLIFNSANGETVPWLAKEWTVADDATGMTFVVRDGVQFSDGEDLTADDVVFSIQTQLDLGAFPYVESVTAQDESTVEVAFNRPYSVALWEVGAVPIIPKHVWESIDDPAKETNETPIGTGPYTEVDNFQGQSYDLLPNPHYWQPEKQKIPGIRMLAYAGNDAANLAAVNGDIDWIPQFIPDIQKVFVDKDPEHRAYWFPTTGNTIQFTYNTTKAPFDDVEVRKALSMAIDRQQVADVAMSGYTHPADCTGLSDNLADWKDESVVDDCSWTEFDTEAAAAMLDDAGYEVGSDGKRTLKDGSPFTFSIIVNATSSDWVSVAQIISKNLEEIGVTATVETQETNILVNNLFTNNFDSAIAWAGHGPTPYSYYRSQFALDLLDESTNNSPENFGRFDSGSGQEVLSSFVSTSVEEDQRALSDELQALYAEEAPAAPLFPSPSWGARSDEHFSGWPTEEDPYADLNPFAATSVIVLTTLEPSK